MKREDGDFVLGQGCGKSFIGMMTIGLFLTIAWVANLGKGKE